AQPSRRQYCAAEFDASLPFAIASPSPSFSGSFTLSANKSCQKITLRLLRALAGRPDVAQSGHTRPVGRCPLSGANRKTFTRFKSLVVVRGFEFCQKFSTPRVQYLCTLPPMREGGFTGAATPHR